MKKFIVTVRRNCNTQDDVKRVVYKDYSDAARNFWKECEMLVRDYMAPEEKLREWFDEKNGIIVKEYGGIIKEDYLEFDGNAISLEEVDEK